MKFDIEILEKYKDEGWVIKSYHEDLPLIIWNYTNATQYEAKWDDITLNCRGLVTDTEGNVISKGFKKFFNYSEGRTNIPENIDWVRIYEKLDGSYIGLFYYDGSWVINSKGSFYSDQVKWAEEILIGKDLNVLNKTWTYCFELIHPNNRIVVDYKDKKDLIFLKAFHVESGTEVDLYKIYGFNHVDSWLESSFKPFLLKELNEDNAEGFVVQFHNGERCKIKFDEYMRLHRIVTNTTSYDIWECLRTGSDFKDILDKVPDEFMDFVTEVKENLEEKFDNKLKEIEEEFYTIINKKEFAEKAKESSNTSFLFTRLNTFSDRLKDSIWRSIKPEYEKAFQKQ